MQIQNATPPERRHVSARFVELARNFVWKFREPPVNAALYEAPEAGEMQPHPAAPLGRGTPATFDGRNNSPTRARR
jgi:hypothetical protein